MTSSKDMKRYDYLFPQIISKENLYKAEKKARKGKTKSKGVQWFDKHPDEYIDQLHEDLKYGRYKTSEYKVFTIYEPKERIIYKLPYYPDRIVHHAVMNIMEPIWTKIFIKNTYSCIKGRGIHKAMNDIKTDLRKDKNGTKYCLKLDIRKFYPSIDHEILKSIIRKKIKDVRLLKLLDEIIDSTNGVPIGNYLSQFFANLYLTYFDHWLKEDKKCKYYYRYADDIVILSDNKEFLHSLILEIIDYLDTNLKLKVKDNWQIFEIDSRGLDFSGYVFRHEYTRVRKTIKNNIFKKVIHYSKTKYTTRDRRISIASYFGWLQYCNNKRLKLKLNTYYNEQIFI